MFIIYDLIFLVFSLVYLPAYLFKGKFHRGFSARLGVVPKNLDLSRPIWIHAVSVGEAKAVRNLLDNLRIEYPGKKFVISTVTATGNKIVRGFAGKDDFVTYLPLDFSFIVNSVIKRLNPGLFIIAETEIWPNLITCLKRNNIPVVIVNARISDRSFKGYSAVKFLLKPVINMVSLFCAQTERDKNRLALIGADEDKVKVTGNLKFDAQDKSPEADKTRVDLRESLCMSSLDLVIIAGSTHPGEEEQIIRAYSGLLDEFSGLKLIIAPRHPERAKEVAGIVSRYGFRPALISEGKIKCTSCIPKPVFILDVIGQLTGFYAMADIVFVGGSLVKKGGQNILEPAALGKPVIFGPNMFNFRDIAGLFLENDACILVSNEEGLSGAVRYLLENPLEGRKLGNKARELFLNNQGASSRTVALIKQIKAD